MLKKENMKNDRLKKILEMLNSDTYCSAHKLSKTLFVSLPTVRRDLAELEQQGLIVRNHGGAKKKTDDKTEIPFEFKSLFKVNEKKRLCKAAAKLVSDNDIIFVDASTSVIHVANYLKDKNNLTVLTNGVATASFFGKLGFNVYCTGGKFIPTSLSFSGDHAAELLEKYNVDIMIFSASGISDNGYIVDTTEEIAALRRRIFKSVRKKVFICDKEKFSCPAPYNVAVINEMDYVICNAYLPKTVKFGGELIIV